MESRMRGNVHVRFGKGDTPCPPGQRSLLHQGMSRRVESRNGETHTKLQGPTGSQIGHSSRNAGKPRTWPRPLGGGWGQRYKGSQRMRMLTTVKSVEWVKWKFPVKFPLS